MYMYIIYILCIYIDIDIDIQNLVNLLSLPAPSRFQGSLILTGGSLKIQGHEEKVTVTTVNSWNEDSMLRSSKKQVEVLAVLASNYQVCRKRWQNPLLEFLKCPCLEVQRYLVSAAALVKLGVSQQSFVSATISKNRKPGRLCPSYLHILKHVETCRKHWHP